MLVYYKLNMDNCYNYLINEELMIKDMSELELNIEYYINFVRLGKSFSGLYEIVRIYKDRETICIVKNINGNIEFTLNNAVDVICFATSNRNPLLTNEILNSFIAPRLKYATCNIYKLPPTEYFLK